MRTSNLSPTRGRPTAGATSSRLPEPGQPVTIYTHYALKDERPVLYSLEELSNAATTDPVWNAAQRELTREGRMHNYLRMLWGKKILEWSAHPREALETMVELNNRYAIDGRDPNSWCGIMWVMGRFDRGWPERPVFGKVRSMSSDSTRRKVKLDGYLSRWGTQPTLL